MKDYFYEPYRLIDYYDDLYGKISADIEFWVHVAKEAGQNVLELACGTGRVTFPLAHAGLNVTAVDSSPEMIHSLINKPEFSQNKTHIHAFEGDMRDISLDKKFDSVVIPANSLNHIQTYDDLKKIFNRTSSHLNPNGVMAFTLLNPCPTFLNREHGKIYDKRIVEKEDHSGSFTFWETSKYDKLSQINHVEYYFEENDSVKKMKMQVRLYYPQEILLFLKQLSDFKIEGHYGFYDKRKFDGLGSTQVFVLRKIHRA